jgi:hypothetical protein
MNRDLGGALPNFGGVFGITRALSKKASGARPKPTRLASVHEHFID